MPDSRRWLENYGVNGRSHGVILHDAAQPKFAWRLSLQGREQWYCNLECLLSQDRAISLMSDDDNQIDGPASPPVTVIVWSPITGKSISQHQYAAPLSLESPHYWVSPQGDRIVWQVSRKEASPLQVWLHRFLPMARIKARPTVGLWISRIDGTDLHEIGHLVVPPQPDDEGDTTLWLDVHWLPGGKRLSYEYHDRLYTVAAD
jgi:hypothetical protein